MRHQIGEQRPQRQLTRQEHELRANAWRHIAGTMRLASVGLFCWGVYNAHEAVQPTHGPHAVVLREQAVDIEEAAERVVAAGLSLVVVKLATHGELQHIKNAATLFIEEQQPPLDKDQEF